MPRVLESGKKNAVGMLEHAPSFGGLKISLSMFLLINKWKDRRLKAPRQHVPRILYTHGQ